MCSAFGGEPPIVGAWQWGNGAAGESGVLVFLPNGIYFEAEDLPDEEDSDGMERGTYTWNETTGAFSATPIVDTNGDWGLNDPLDSVIVNGDKITFTDSEGSEVFDRVFSPTSSIVGAWQWGNGAAGESGVLVFLPNGIYFEAEDLPDEEDSDGMERGTYIWNETTGAFSATPIVDTNGDWGLNDPLDSVIVNGDKITFTDSEGSEVFDRVIYIEGLVAIGRTADQFTVDFSGILEESADLKNWQGILPQPTDVLTFTSLETGRYFKARGK